MATSDHYEIRRVIGKGAFGKVLLAVNKLTGMQVAIKCIEKSYLTDEYQKRKVMQEIHILKQINHKNVIGLYEVFETVGQILIVMEHAAGGDMYGFLRRKKRLSETDSRPFFR